MKIAHRPGNDYVNADGLSRIPNPLVQCNYYSYGCDVQDLISGIFQMTGFILSHIKIMFLFEYSV